MYLYRFDPLDNLRQQGHDPVLRAKRVTEQTGRFDHFQVIERLETLSPKEGIFRFCFWKSWESAVFHFPALRVQDRPWVMQRIRMDHPVFRQFERDDDEYLRDDAWIFWLVAHPQRNLPNWSPIGIPHSEIEVLHSHGYWEPLVASEMLGGREFDGWHSHILQGFGAGPCPAYSRTMVRCVDGKTEAWVLIRQKSGPWTSVLHADHVVRSCVMRELDHVSNLHPGQIRWIVAAECHDRVLAYEMYPRFSTVSHATGVKGWVQRMLGHHAPELMAHIDRASYRALATAELQSLYADFGIAPVLLLHRRFMYPEHFFSTPTVRSHAVASAGFTSAYQT